MEGLLKEYSFSITDQSYTVGEASDSTDSTDSEAEVKVAAAYARAKTVVPDKQGIELTNRLSGTKTVYWHKLWDDSYVYSEGNRPDIYLDIFQLVHKEDEHGNLKQYVEPYIRDYRWDYSADTEVTETVIDNGNLKTHWHVVLDNLPKYDEETGREYYYYAVERAKVNIKQFDYADVTYYVTNDNSTPDVNASNEDWTAHRRKIYLESARRAVRFKRSILLMALTTQPRRTKCRRISNPRFPSISITSILAICCWRVAISATRSPKM